MARTAQGDRLQDVNEFADCMAIGEIFSSIPSSIVDDALKVIDRTKHRLSKFPDHLVVYFVILMCIFMDRSYIQIFEALQGTLSWLSNFGLDLEDLSDAAITKARRRVGFEPLQALFKSVSDSIMRKTAPGERYQGYRLCLLDGTVFDVPDTPENQILGSRRSQNGFGALPQFRVVALMEYSTRAVIDIELASMVGNGEIPLAKALCARVGAGSLIIADRQFPGTDLCRLIQEQQSDFLFRAKGSLKLKPIDSFDDGSFTANLCERHEKPLLVRVIQYRLGDTDEVYRLITSILDWQKVSAHDLASLYPRRWTAETIYEDIKNVLRAPKIILRSKSPTVGAQEIYALFLAYNVIRAFMLEAAHRAGVPPSDLSFHHSLLVLKNHLPTAGDFSP